MDTRSNGTSNANASSPTAKKKPSVLIIEDEQELANMIRERLIAENYAVQVADKISDAQQRLSNQAYQCIIMDMRVKQGDTSVILESLAAERKIRGNATVDPRGQNAQAPIIMISGYFDSDAVKRIAPLTRHLLVKPFSIRDLIERVKTLAPGAAFEA